LTCIKYYELYILDWNTYMGQVYFLVSVRTAMKNKCYLWTARLLCAYIILIPSSWWNVTIFAEVFQVHSVHNQRKCDINLPLRTVIYLSIWK
jgi:hypothetical protein